MAEESEKGTKNPMRQDGVGKDSEQIQQSAKVNPQDGSLLFRRLPQEMRDHIWTLLFRSTRFSFGKGPFQLFGHIKLKPAPNGLALLRTCRRAQLEIGDSWLRHVLFCFADVEAMLDKLTALPVDTLAKIRHMRVGRNARLKIGRIGPRYYPLVSALKLLPGLRLDQLTVFGPLVTIENYELLDGLVEDGNGWKILRYLCCHSAMLGFASEHDNPHLRPSWEANPNYWRKLQPKHWQTVLEARDGAASNPSVTVYRAKDSERRSGAMFDPSRRVKFEQKPHPSQDLRADVFPADPELMAEGENEKELMVVARRGSGVDYEEKKDSPLIRFDIRRDFPGMTWAQIRASHIDTPEERDEYYKEYLRNLEEVEDIYEDAEDYCWAMMQYSPKFFTTYFGVRTIGNFF